MKRFEYADEKISDREIMMALPSMMIGVVILSLPRDLASVTVAADGWIVLLVGGVIAIILTWLFTKLAAGFPGQTFFSYSSLIVTKPVAIILSFLFSILWLGVTAYEVRKISDISTLYLFDNTPVEVIALAFLLVVVYAVSNTRVGLLRLNILFLPIIIFISFLVFALNIGGFSPGNLLPMFETSPTGFLKGFYASASQYFGYTIVLFYVGLIEKPKHTVKKAMFGMSIPVILFIFLFIMCIGVFGHDVTANLLYPTIDLSTGTGTLQRFESVFFVIWIMAIFNTTSMALDVAVMAVNSVFKKVAKVKIVLIMSPIVYLTSMVPQQMLEVMTFGTVLGNITLLYGISVTILLLAIAKVRGVKGK